MQTQEAQPKSNKSFPILTFLLVLMVLFICEGISGAIKSVGLDSSTSVKNPIYILAPTVFANTTSTATAINVGGADKTRSDNFAMIVAQPAVTLNLIPNTAQTERAFLVSPHGDGYYLIGIDIAPGSWRSEPGNDGCYWQRTDRTGNIIDNHFGTSGGVVFLPVSDYQIQLEGCGMWTYLGQ